MVDHSSIGQIHATPNATPRACAVGSAAASTTSTAAPPYHHHFCPFNISRNSASSIAPKRNCAGPLSKGDNVTTGDIVPPRDSASAKISGESEPAALRQPTSNRLRAGSNLSNSSAENATSTSANPIHAIRDSTIPPVHSIPFHTNVECTKLRAPTSSENEKLLFVVGAASRILFQTRPNPAQS